MSAPQTNLEKQKRRHRGPLIGIVVALLFGAGLAIFWAASGADDAATTPDAIPIRIEAGPKPAP